MLYCSWDMVRDRCNFFHFGLFFALLPRELNIKKKKINKKKKPGDIIILHMCTKNYDHMMQGSWDKVHEGRSDRQTDERTDRRKKWHIEVGAPPKNVTDLLEK